jgi:hypothetical protein
MHHQRRRDCSRDGTLPRGRKSTSARSAVNQAKNAAGHSRQGDQRTHIGKPQRWRQYRGWVCASCEATHLHTSKHAIRNAAAGAGEERVHREAEKHGHVSLTLQCRLMGRSQPSRGDGSRGALLGDRVRALLSFVQTRKQRVRRRGSRKQAQGELDGCDWERSQGTSVWDCGKREEQPRAAGAIESEGASSKEASTSTGGAWRKKAQRFGE